jgi:hypothetical protein
MKLQRHHVWWALIVTALALAAHWLSNHLEKALVNVFTPPSRQAQQDPQLAAKRLLQKLGFEVQSAIGLEPWPPARATLVLSALHWNMFPEREAQLKRWVQAGGHLVLEQYMVEHNKSLKSWIPTAWATPAKETRLRSEQLKDKKAENDKIKDLKNICSAQKTSNSAAALSTSASSERMPEITSADGTHLREPPSVQTFFTPRRTYLLCDNGFTSKLQSPKPPQWAVAHGDDGFEMLRLAVGAGHVTVWANDNFTHNHQFFKGDNSLLLLASLKATSKDQAIWFVDEEARPSWLTLLWKHAMAVVLLGGLTLLLALWRASTRFGPLGAVPLIERRSMAEQIRGTAAFMAKGSAPTLYQAQRLALEHAARTHIARFDQQSPEEQSQAMAQALGHPSSDHSAVHAAWCAPANERDQLRALAVLEKTRRALIQQRHQPTSDPKP